MIYPCVFMLFTQKQFFIYTKKNPGGFMKKNFFTALTFGLLFTACAPRAQMSASINAEKIVLEEPSFMSVKHKVRPVEGKIPQTKIVNMSLADSVTISEKTHVGFFQSGNVFKIETSLDGHISKVYFVDTRTLTWDESLSVVITPLSIGEGADTLGTIVPGDGVLPVPFNNQPAMPVVFHPGNSVAVTRQ